MALTIPSPNILLGFNDDKLGKILIELKNRLVATGLWRVRGSGTGSGGTGGSTFELMGQTAGVGGSFDVFTSSPGYLTNVDGTTVTWTSGGAGSISRTNAWIVMEEIATGRCWRTQRTSAPSQSDGATLLGLYFSNAGVASSGASATVPPAMLTPSAAVIGVVVLDASLALTTNAHWLQIGVGGAAEAGNVCPFWWSVFNRTTGTKTYGMVYESLTDAPTGELHPYVVGAGSWANLFNDNFGQQRFFGGAALTARGFTGYHLVPGRTTFMPNNVPATNSQPVGVDGFWRTYRPMVLDSAGTFLGRSQNFLMHPINRDYPTTYGLAGADPRLALGQLLFPWAQNVVPNSTP